MTDEKQIILFVDDEADILEMYRDLFDTKDFDILTASSAIEALEVCKANKNIKVIISDSHMKEMSGIQLLKTLKSLFESIPLFYLATGDLTLNEQDIKSLGGHGLMLKPFDLDEILNIIKTDLNL